MAVEVSKASAIKKKLITKYHKLYLHIDSGKYIKNFSKFHRHDNLTEKLSIEENVISEFLDRSDGQNQFEGFRELNLMSSEEKRKIDIEDVPPGSIVIRIIVKKGLIVEKTFQTPSGSNILVFF